MANIYFEFPQNVIDMKLFPHRYIAKIDNTTDPVTLRRGDYMLNADRIWCEQNGFVWYLKHGKFPTPKVDMKEFMWIKLQAEFIKEKLS